MILFLTSLRGQLQPRSYEDVHSFSIFRDFMTRSDRYKRALAMTNRVIELKDIHKWSTWEYNIAMSLIDELIPMALHAFGESEQ